MGRLVLASVVVPLAVLSGCALHGKGDGAPERFEGDWVLDRSFGVSAPEGLTQNVRAGGDRLDIVSHWTQPVDRRYVLILAGLTTPELVIDTTGRRSSVQAGPFVIRYMSGWQNGRVVTYWSTSSFMGTSYHGTWQRSVSRDGTAQVVDIDTTASDGEVSRARLIFRKVRQIS